MLKQDDILNDNVTEMTYEKSAAGEETSETKMSFCLLPRKVW